MSHLKKFLHQLLKIKKEPTLLVLFIIFFIALGLRFYQLDKSVWMQFGYDESRDMLVASHIVDNHEFLSRGPLAAGGLNWLKNSPIYYYFVALIWVFSGNPLTFMYLWALIMSTPILIGYLIGKKIKDKQTGLIIAIIFAINHQMIASSRELLQPHLLLLFASAFIWSGLSFIKSKNHKLRYLILMIIFALIPLHFHYGILISLPTIFLFIVYSWIILNKNDKKPSLKKIFTPIITLGGIITSWIILTYRIYPLDQFYFFIFNFEKNYNNPPLIQLQETILTLNKMVWGDYFSNLGIIIFIISFIVLISKILTNKKREVIFKKMAAFLLFISSSIFLFIFYKNFISETYLLFIFPFFLILLTLSFRLITERYKTFGTSLIVLVILIMTSFTLKRIFTKLPTTSYHDQQKEIAQEIYNHYQSLNIKTSSSQPKLLITWYTTNSGMPFDGWGTSGTWFYLEKLFKQSLIKNSSYGLNHAPLNKYPKIIYLICDHRMRTDLIQTECLDRFTRSYPILNNKLEYLTNNLNISAWSAKVDPKNKNPIYNVVHKDLMSK